MPTSPLDARDPTFHALMPPDAKPKKLAGGFHFLEGPAWQNGGLLFSDNVDDVMYRYDERAGVAIFRRPSRMSNGNTIDPRSRLVTCEQTTRAITRTELDGTCTTLADRWQGKRFNSPNDVIVQRDGTVWFSDPPYGVPKGEAREIDGQYVFRIDTDGMVTAVITDMQMPNGLCFSPDEQLLYVDESKDDGPKNIRAYDVGCGHSLSNPRIFAAIDTTTKDGVPDGMRVDQHGNVWSTAGDGIQIFSPAGQLVGKIPLPEAPANLCWGGSSGRTLFLTVRSSLYSIETLTTDCTWGRG